MRILATWLLLWLAGVALVAAGILAGALLLRLVAPDVASAASRFEPVRSAGAAEAPATVDRESEDVRPSGAPFQPRTSSPEPVASLPVPSPSLRAGQRLAAERVPTPSATGTHSGPASWYDAGSGMYAAVPGYHGPESVTVCDSPSHCLTLPVVTSCWCRGGRVVDLSPDAFRYFAPLSRGLVTVTIEREP